ncbi:MAG TPA: hypothetical protein VM600_06510, partial [Actinomycetota bacterium]|nr:hypothetical protein [Actinomycetota bacterium]
QSDVAGNAGTALSNAAGLIIDTHAPSVAALIPADATVSNVTRRVIARYDEPLSAGTVVLRNGRGTLVGGTTQVTGNEVAFAYAGGHLPEAGNPFTAVTTGTDLVSRPSGDRTWTFTVDIKPFVGISTPSHSVALPGAAVVSGTAQHDLALRNPTVRLTPETGVGPSYGPYTTTCTGCATGSARWSFAFPVDIVPNRYLATAVVCDVENHCSDQRSITIYIL